MILRNRITMSFLKIKISPLGDILAHILTMTFLETKGTHYVVNPKHAQLIGTILLFATKKAKQHAVSESTTQHDITSTLATFTRSPAPFLKVTKTQIL